MRQQVKCVLVFEDRVILHNALDIDTAACGLDSTAAQEGVRNGTRRRTESGGGLEPCVLLARESEGPGRGGERTAEAVRDEQAVRAA